MWKWEIQGRPRELGIKLYGTDFKMESAAKLAGEKALVTFLDGLAKEERKAQPLHWPCPTQNRIRPWARHCGTASERQLPDAGPDLH